MQGIQNKEYRRITAKSKALENIKYIQLIAPNAIVSAMI